MALSQVPILRMCRQQLGVLADMPDRETVVGIERRGA